MLGSPSAGSAPRHPWSPIARGCTFAIGLLMCLLAGVAPARAFTVSGFVRDPGGAPIPAADIDLYVSLTGQFVFLAADSTDALGHYAIEVPAADTYDIVFGKPSGSRFFDRTLADQPLSGPTTIDVVLEAGVYVTGQVRDGLGNPVPSMDMDFELADTGVAALATGDGTDGSGNFTTLVAPGVLHVQCKPAVSTRLVPRQLEAVPLTSDTTLGLITLESGRLLKGKVKGFDGDSVADADLDAFQGDVQMFTSSDNTSGSGDFELVLAPGTYRLCVDPPAASDYAPRFVHDVVIPSGSDTDLGEVILPRGWRVSGTVTDAMSQPVPAVDLDAFDSGTGIQVATTRDDTAPDGTFSLKLAAGAYRLTFDPPLATRLVGQLLGPWTVSGDLNLGTLVLPAGVILSGTVTDPDTDPIVDGVLEVLPPGGSTPIYVTGAKTGPTGSYAVALPAGTYDLVMHPPAGSPLPAKSVTGYSLTGDQVLDFQLGATTGVDSDPSLRPLSLRASGTTLELELAQATSALTLDVFDLTGRRLARLWKGALEPGQWSFSWPAGAAKRPGVYFAKASAGALAAVARVVVVR